jgi:hypothetical protein
MSNGSIPLLSISFKPTPGKIFAARIERSQQGPAPSGIKSLHRNHLISVDAVSSCLSSSTGLLEYMRLILQRLLRTRCVGPKNL